MIASAVRARLLRTLTAALAFLGLVALVPAGEAHRPRDNGGVGRVASSTSRDRKLIR
jgi:hypothetical protein